MASILYSLTREGYVHIVASPSAVANLQVVT